MNDISKKQSMEGNVKIAAAFRYAYKRAKLWKSLIWALILVLTMLQLLAAINHQNLTAYLPDNLSAMVVTVSLLSILMSTLGKHYLVNRFVSIGSKLQRLHDSEVLGLGVKPTILEIRPSQVESMSKHWLESNPTDRPNLSEWWPNSVSELPGECRNYSLPFIHLQVGVRATPKIRHGTTANRNCRNNEQLTPDVYSRLQVARLYR